MNVISNNIRISKENLLENASITASSAATLFPASNLVSESRTETFRTTNGTHATLVFNLTGKPNYANTFWLINHNLTQTGTIRLIVSNNSDLSDPIKDITFDAHEPIIPFGDLKFGDGSFGGYFTSDQITKFFTDAVMSYNFDGISGDYWAIVLSESSAASLSYLEIGVAFLTESFQPTFNIDYGCSLEPIEMSTKTITDGGKTFINLLPKRRKITINFSNIAEDELNWDYFFLNYVLRLKPLCLDVLPNERADKREFWKIYCRNAEPKGYVLDSLNITKSSGSLVFEEEL